MKKITKIKFKIILYIIGIILCGIIVKFQPVLKNVETSLVLQGLKSGNNTVAEYSKNIPEIIHFIFSILGLVFTIRVITLIVQILYKKFGGKIWTKLKFLLQAWWSSPF